MTDYNLDKFLDHLVKRMQDLDAQILALTTLRESDYRSAVNFNRTSEQERAQFLKCAISLNEHIQSLLSSLQAVETTVQSVLMPDISNKNKPA
ncbi:hypothetical protein BGZ95_012035 [Linnemannia exigua]|uniref:Uncharacterized protein n=1 Tax=Linnemannia exigua TaxID=604196 RepID=A0AAD4HB47_9FUNG|nr:hypothetical protein BGZ95_012035 [Linnemannia exigua]